MLISCTYFTKNENPLLFFLTGYKLVTDKIHSIPQRRDKCNIWVSTREYEYAISKKPEILQQKISISNKLTENLRDNWEFREI